MCLRDWNEDGEPGALGKNVKLSRFKDSQRVKYSLRKGGNVKDFKKIQEEVMDLIIDIPEALETRWRINIKRAGWNIAEENSSSSKNGSEAVDENDAVVEDDMFEVSEDEIKPTINAGDFNE